MNAGVLFIVLASVSCITFTVTFFLAARGRDRFESLARRAYKYYLIFVIHASVLLMYYFIGGDYSYKYVYDYSSSDLPLSFLISSFWAGQQGTYLLWALFSGVLGFYILKRGRGYTNYAMFFYGLINLFFCSILMVLSPFEKLAVPQLDGAGLNPLLQDPWMVIHPPVIFVGYAVVAIPAVIAMAAMVKKDYSHWLNISFAPAALGALTLAAGNIMGGFWAYKTLGWGGYWAWDPVENSSFIPWMTCLALTHGLLIERYDGALRKTNLFLALFTYILVVYGTFLTRSGVLADFSVHSFVDLGVNQYLIGFMLGFTALSFGILLYRVRGIKGPSINLKTSSQEFALFIGMWMLFLIALMVLAGTSWPLITTIFGDPGTVDIAVYTRVTFPLAIVAGLFLGIAPFLLWRGGEEIKIVKSVVPSFLGAMVITVLTYFLGVHSISYLLFIFFCLTAVFSNLIVFFRKLPDKVLSAGAPLAHIGFSLMLLGILGSSAYSTSQKVVIDRDGSATAFDLVIVYKGMQSDITEPNNELLLDVTDGETWFEARPRLFWSQRLEGLMKKPYIKRYLTYDIYMAPERIQELDGENGLELSRGDTIILGQYTIIFADFDQGSHGSDQSEMTFGAILLVTDSLGNMVKMVPSQKFIPGQSVGYIDAFLATGADSSTVRLEKIYADRAAIKISIEGLTPKSPPDRLVLDVSKKPTMNVLWAGTIIMGLGGILSLRTRWKGSSIER